MKAYHLDSFGDVEGINMRQQNEPVPNEHEVLVKVRTVSLNRRDWYILHQTYPLPGRLGVIPLSDGAGEVIAMGSAVTRFKKGDRVMGNYFARWRDGRMGIDIMDQLGCTLDGMLCEYAVLREEWLVHVPANLSWEEAATLPCAALTAWSALSGISAGNTVLTIGSGGVSLFAIQFAKLFGASVIALTSRDQKIKSLQSIGADHVLNYVTNPFWHQQVLALTEGRGVDRLIETGGMDTLEQSVQATTLGGEIVLLSPVGTIGTVNTPDIRKILSSLFVKLITLRSHFVGSRLEFETMNRAIAQNNVRPVIDKVFSFAETPDAYRYLGAGEQFGKVIISVS
jgi:NADPH:quinone reductase-like Zn-dependent oxidoreductase